MTELQSERRETAATECLVDGPVPRTWNSFLIRRPGCQRFPTPITPPGVLLTHHVTPPPHSSCPTFPGRNCPGRLGANTTATVPFPDYRLGFQQIPTFWSLGCSPNSSQGTISQHRNGLQAGQISWKARGEWERRQRRLRTRDGLHPTLWTAPTLWNLPGTDLLWSGTISFSSSLFPLPQAHSHSEHGELVLRRRNNDQNKKDFCTRQLLVTWELRHPPTLVPNFPSHQQCGRRGPASIHSLPHTRPCYSFFANPISL